MIYSEFLKGGKLKRFFIIVVLILVVLGMVKISIVFVY